MLMNTFVKALNNYNRYQTLLLHFMSRRYLDDQYNAMVAGICYGTAKHQYETYKFINSRLGLLSAYNEVIKVLREYAY